MWIIFRFISVCAGMYFCELIMQQQIGHFMETGTSVLPIWVFVFTIALGFIVAKRGPINKAIGANMTWLICGMLIEASIWMFQRTELQFQIAIFVMPVLSWYLTKNAKKIFELSPEQIEAMEKRVLR